MAADKSGHGRITRRQFVRRAGIGAAAIGAAAAGLGGVAHAAPGDMNPDPANIDGGLDSPQITVRPTGIVQKDVANLQWAVNNVQPGGTVLLKAQKSGDPPTAPKTPFNMGMPLAPPTIAISKPMTVTGEEIANVGKTTIMGGFGTFAVDTIKGDPSAEPSGPVNFETMESHGAGYFFISYRACVGALIQGVDIYDTVPKYPSASFPWGSSVGIRILTDRPVYYPPEKINGKITISDCLFDNSNTGELASNWAVSAEQIRAEISVCDSVFNNVGGRCVMFWDVGPAEIRRNHMVSTIAEQDYFLAQHYLREHRPIHVSGSSWEDPDLQIEISDNVIDFRAVNKYKYPMLLIGMRVWGAESAKIENNTIFMDPGDNALSNIYISSAFELLFSEIVCSGNTVAGHMLEGALAYWCSGSEFSGNDMSGLTSEYYQLSCFEADGNYFGRGNGGIPNKFGQVSNSYIPTVICDGNGNTFDHNDFTQTGKKGFSVASSGIARAGCMFLEYGTSGNTVNVATSELPPLEYPWYEPCSQIADATYDSALGHGSNTINWTFDLPQFPGPCDSNKYAQLIHMLSQYSDYQKLKEELAAKTAATAKTP